MDTITKDDILTYMWIEIPSAVTYWANVEESEKQLPLDIDRYGIRSIPYTYTLTEHDYGDEYTLTAGQFHAALNTWARNSVDHADNYQALAARNILSDNWDDVDHDAHTIDMVVQYALFGSVTYS